MMVAPSTHAVATLRALAGELVEGVFVVSQVGFPPLEPRDSSLLRFPILDMCGLESYKPGGMRCMRVHCDGML